MNKNLTILFLLFFSTICSHSQEMVETISKQICECLEQKQVTDSNEIEPCFEKAIIKNLEMVYKAYDIESIDDFDFDKFGVEVGTKLMTECDYAMENLVPSENKLDKNFITEENLDCSKLKSGEYYYVFPNPVSNVNDTTFVTIKGKMYMERMNKGRSYSLLDINWINDCKFDLIFKDSNDAIKKNMSKSGDIYNYEVISSTANSFIIKLDWKNQLFKFELFQTK